MLQIHTTRSSTFFRAVVACLAELARMMNGQVMVYLSLVCLSELLISASTAISVPTAEDPALLGHHLSFHGRRGAATTAAATAAAAVFCRLLLAAAAGVYPAGSRRHIITGADSTATRRKHRRVPPATSCLA